MPFYTKRTPQLRQFRKELRKHMTDEEQHADPEERKKDALRTQRIEQLGYKVIRIPNREIWKNFKGVKEYIYREMKKRMGV